MRLGIVEAIIRDLLLLLSVATTRKALHVHAALDKEGADDGSEDSYDKLNDGLPGFNTFHNNNDKKIE